MALRASTPQVQKEQIEKANPSFTSLTTYERSLEGKKISVVTPLPSTTVPLFISPSGFVSGEE